MVHAECEFYSPSCDPASFWMYVCVCLVLVTCAGMMAGLTMGLLSLDKLNMRILEMEGTDSEKTRAATVLPILNRHHFLLVTLLLVNAGANEALPIFLNKLVPEAVSIVLSVTCVLFFGEIIPSAIFTGPNQLKIAASLAPMVKALMLVTAPVAYPISKLLDYLLGDDHSLAQYKRKELKALIALQRENDEAKRIYLSQHSHSVDPDGKESSPSSGRGSSGSGSSSTSTDSHKTMWTPTFANSAHSTRLHVDEVTIIHGALDLSSKTVTNIMIPMKQVYMLEYDTKLTEHVMADILASGHSRIPVYKEYRSNIVGLLLVKRLIVLDPEDERPIRDLVLRKPIVTTPNESCYSILNEFQKGRSHIALLTRQADAVMRCWEQDVDVPRDVEFLGIVTIEDVIEELIQEEIEDESDMYVHDIVDYWGTKARKKRVHEAGRTFVKKKLKLLAERARRRVRNRHKAAELANRGANALDAPIQVKVVTETTPLVPKVVAATSTMEAPIQVTIVSETTALLQKP
ncbi:TPA: hypothetical protein N0F65_001752 [Lagenidium giganteum]|uniref:CNNM transmembrane domain-containing protein n=1 Tax=Lagenidium giganteum TaxID=4803 RepID=A0AAV2Z6V1_9STRA|nr:TPA: hypothetical protein N0F65_001752 [Lagenidium giganteum]